MSRNRFLDRVTATDSIESLNGRSEWLASAPAGAYAEYHRGLLASDRVRDRDLSERANLAMILAERGAVALGQRPVPGSSGIYAYGLTVIASTQMPKHLIAGKITPSDYAVLTRIIEDQHLNGMSLQRRVRYALNTSSEDRARQWLERAQDAGWITCEPNAGYAVAPQGAMILA